MRYCVRQLMIAICTQKNSVGRFAGIFLLGCLVSGNVFAQPGAISTNNLTGAGTYNCTNLTDNGKFRQARIQAGTSSSGVTWEFPATCAFPGDVWRPYFGGSTAIAFNTYTAPNGVSNIGALYNSSNGGASGTVATTTNSNYYTFNVEDVNSGIDAKMEVLETSYNPVTINSVTQSPTGSFVYSTYSPTITATTSATLNTSEYLYIRYAINDINFGSSTLVQMSGSGTTYTASIPAQASGTNVYYYVFSSNKTLAQLNTDKASNETAVDMGTLNFKTLTLNAGGNTNYSYTSTSNPVVINSSGGTASASYATLQLGFAAINSGTHTGTISVLIEGNTTETVTSVLNASGSGSASYTAISVQPVGAITVSGSVATYLMQLNGADNITINGLNSGGNSLAISNTNTGGNTIFFGSDATNNTIQNCTINGASSASGVISFGAGTVTGNDNNTITNCTIGSSGSNPAYGIVSNGSSAVIDNSSITISNCNIQDYFSASVSSGGIYVATNSSAWTISGNRLFQTATRLYTTSNTHSAVQISTGSGYTISNNIIGYANSSGTGTTNMVGNSVSLTGTFPSSYSTTGSANATRYIAINCAFTAGGTVSNIQGNTIAGIALFTSSGATTTNGILCGINITSGNANIGTTTANTIGATSGQGSLYAATTQTGGTVVGIYAISVNTVSIQNNTFGSIDAVGSSPTISGAFTAIDCAGASGIFTIDNNTIGNTTADNIRIGYTLSGGNLSNAGTLTSTTGTSSALVGVRNAATGSTLSISSNTLRGWATSGTVTTVSGITNTGAITSTETINSNLLGTSSLDWIRYSVANSGNLFGILNSAGGSSAALTIQSNDVRGITHSVAGSSTHTYISNTAATLSQNISSNTFTALSVNTTGTVNFISNSVTLTGSGTKTVNSNSVVTSFSKTGAGNNVYFYYDNPSTFSTTGTITNNSNNFSNITVTGATIIQGWYDNDGAAGVTKNIQNNTFSTLNGGTNAVFPLQIGNGTGSISGNTITGASAQNTVTGIGVTSGTFNIYSNTINTLSTVTPGLFAGVTGIYISGGTTISVYQNTINSLTTTATSSLASGITVSSGTTVNVYKNKIYGLANNSSSFASVGVTGITLSGGTTVTVYNNYVGDLTVSSVGINDAIRGIGISAGSGTMNVYFNTVYITGTSAGSGFGTSAVYANTGPTVNLRNNVFVNLSTPTGTGRAIAYWRNGATLTSYASTSNNNLFYTGTPGSVNLIYYDNTTSARTLAEFQGMLSNGGGTRDIYSVTENPTFLSTTGSSANFLHINTTATTYIESRGVNIAGITDDYDGDIRQGNGGYGGTGTAPDIGADEFDATPITCGTVIVTSTGGTGAPSSCYFTLAAAVSAINSGTIHTGTITCSVPAGFIETAPAGGYQLTASGTSATPITYIKSGAGANPAITASASLTSGALTDGIFKLIGADYTTIDGFTIQENGSNTTTTSGSNNMTEWGVALLRTSTTDGAQNNTIQNCTISLNKSYNNTFGIYSNTIHTATAVSYVDIASVGGANNNNKVYTNSISNINMGISFVGSRIAAFIDDGNDIGGANSSKGNTISNWGSASINASFTTVSVSGTFFGIYMNHQKTYNVSYNTLTSSTISPGSTSINGIRSDYTTATPTGTFTNTISNNTISLNATATTGLFIGINSINPTTSPTAGITLNITNNLIQNCSIAGVSTASLNGIANTLVCSYLNITGNSYLNNTSTSTSGAVNAISNSGAIITSINIDNNSIGNSSFGAITFSNANSGAHVFITNTAGAATCALSISTNNFQGIVHSTAGSGGHTYISNTAATASQNISSNTFTNLFANNTGSITFISNSVALTATGSKTISSNSIVTAYNKTSSGGTVTFYNDGALSTSGGTNTNSNNNFSNVTLTGATNMQGWLNSETNTTKTIQNNTFSNISGVGGSCEILTVSGSASANVSNNTISTITGSGSTLRGIVSTSGTQSFYNNNINGLTLSSASFTVAGIAITNGTTQNVYKNKIYDLTESNATVNTTNGAVNGIQVLAGTTISIFNNLVGDLKATTASSTTDAIRGININSTTANSNINLYYNTIYLSATSSGANFSTSGLYHTTGVSSTAALDMRNNIIVNNSTPQGTGNTAAYRRSTTALTNYATTSNNNLLYAGTASATRLIFTDGTNSDQTMSAFITRVSTREANSVSENPPFLSTSGSSANFLHIDNSVSTVVESGGAVVAISPTGDYDGDARYGDGGYSGTGTAPDIGADEINAPVTSNYYFRSKSTGIWANPTYWESSPDGSTWANATSYPTSAATKINVLNTHTITISSTTTANALQVDNGGTLSHTNGIGFTIADGTGNDGSGTDFIVNGTYVINGSQPTFNASATAEIRSGGVVRADANTGGASDDFARNTSVLFKTGSVFLWNTTALFESGGSAINTYFQGSGYASEYPIFRVASGLTTLSGTFAFNVNGKFEFTGATTLSFQNTGTKTFRDGLGGTGTITHNNTCGTFIISGSSAVIDGTGTINIDNATGTDLQISTGGSCTISSGSTVNLNIGTLANPGSLFVVDGTLTHNGTTAVNFNTGSGDLTVNGSLGNGTGTFSLNSTATDIIVGGTSGGSAGTFKFTTGALTATTFTMTRSGASADATLGSDFTVSNGFSNSSATFTIGANTLTMNGTVSGSGTFTGSSSSNMTIGGTTGGAFGTLYFTTGSQTLNNFTLSRSGTTPSVILGSSLTVGNTFSNTASTFTIGSNTLTMNGTISGTGTFTGSTSSNITVGGTSGGAFGTLYFTTGAQTLNNLTVSRTGASASATMGTDLSVNNILDITNSAASFSMNGFTLTLAGTITGSGSLYGTTSSNLTMTGTGQVGTLRFATGGQLLNTLSINRTGTTGNYAALLGSSLTVNALTLTSGIIATDNNLLTWTNSSPGLLQPATQTSYTANTTSYKNSYICLCTSLDSSLTLTTPYDGTVGFKVNNVGTDTWFPVGVDFKSPNRMWINNTGTVDDITVAIKKGDIGGTDKPVVERIWYVKEGTTGGTTADMRLYFTKQNPSLYPGSQDEVESGFIYTDQHLVQKNYNDPNYIDVAQFGDVQDGSTNTLGTELYGQYTITTSPDILGNKDGINQFSRFTVLNISNIILPVTVVNLAAYQSGNHVNVLWTSLTEINMDHYEVERSINGLQFTSLGKITAKGNGLQKTDYSFTDMLPNNGNNFYRIKIFDKSGRISYTSVVSVHIGGGITGITVYPNPVVGKTVTLAFSNMEAGSYAVTIYDNAGKRVYTKQIEHTGGSASYVMYLPAYMVQGVYHVNIQNKKYQTTKEILVE